MFADEQDRHAQMAGARDTDGDGQISPQEAAAYVQDYLKSATPEERAQMLKAYFGTLSPDERQQVGNAMVQSPASPVQQVDPHDDEDLARAYTQTAQVPMDQTQAGQVQTGQISGGQQQSQQHQGQQASQQGGLSPLQEVFAPGGALSSPLVKAGLVGLAGIIGSRLLQAQR